MIEFLKMKEPAVKNYRNQELFEEESQRFLSVLLATRLFVLKALLNQSNVSIDPFQWFCIQRSRRSQELFCRIFNVISRFSKEELSLLYNGVRASFKGRVIFDESQHLLSILSSAYRSCKAEKRSIEGNTILHQRSLFSFLSSFILKSDFLSIWCGTQMGIRNMELFYSAAAGKSTNSVAVFTDFNYLTPSHIKQLLPLWLNVDFNSNGALLNKIAHFLQGRPRILMNFLLKLINCDDVEQSFDDYRKELTTDSNPNMNFSFFAFWRDRINRIISPLEPGVEKKQYWLLEKRVCDVLLKLCASFLTGNGSDLKFVPEEDLVSTNLVMVSLKSQDWTCKMAEPLVITAGLNYLASIDRNLLMDYLSADLFTPLTPANLTAQERGHRMEFLIALRFFSCWWNEDPLRKFLPDWANKLNIEKPIGILDCRTGSFTQNQFLLQLKDPSFPWLVLPSTGAGPDLRYSIFCCNVKTTSTANSASSMFVPLDKCRENFEKVNFAHWYGSEKSLNKMCISSAKSLLFVHLLFELPDSAPTIKDEPESGLLANGDYFIRINLHSEFAKHFFGETFVQNYMKFVSLSVNSFKSQESPIFTFINV